jgi:Fe-S-cluster containining protein
MKELERFKKTVLEEYPRMGMDSRFCFRCHKGVPCFNECCRDVNIFLTPYDIIRLKNKLEISSEEFLKKYTITPFDQNLKYPILLLKMQDDEKKSCPFVGEEGCTVYQDRPWACRMYPLGLASPKEEQPMEKNDFFFLLKEEVCRGFDEDNEQSVREWIEDQQINLYNEMGKGFKEITLHSYFQEGKDLSPQRMEMFFMVCYNIDKFRDFVFKSTFLDKFEVDEETLEKIRDDDVELLNFGYRWLELALFGEKTLDIKADVLEAGRKDLEEKQGKKL